MTSRHRVVRVARLLGLGPVMLGLVSGCGGSATARIDAASATELRQAVQAIRTAVARHDQAGARTAVTTLRQDIAGLETKGKLNRADARILDAETSQVLARIAQVRPATRTTSTTSTSPPTTAAPAKNPKPPPDSGPGKGKDKGKGKGGGHGH